MPSSICCPSGVNSHLAVERMFSFLKVSPRYSRAKSLRLLTHGPRLVVPVTSGDVVTILWASLLSPFDRSSRILPNPICVEISRSEFSSIAGTGIKPSVYRRRPFAKNGFMSKNFCNSLGFSIVANFSHSSPSATPICFCHAAIWVLFIRPPWLSL